MIAETLPSDSVLSPAPSAPRNATNARAAATSPTVVAPGRFTRDGSPELEKHLAVTCAKIAAGLRGLLPVRKLEAVLLGGGYGRGEGGVLRTPEGDRPYNDLEFYVCLRGSRHLNERLYGHALHVLGEILTPQAGVEVEFKITSLHELLHAPVSMFSYDLFSGHRWLVGEAALLRAGARHLDATAIPLAEATRLLMNRCTGLLLAAEKLERARFTAADADFVRRNLAKAELALGDALLVARGEYHWSASERLRRLERLRSLEDLPALPEVRRHHAEGVAFKLHPERSLASRETLLAEHRALAPLALQVWLWVESRRLGVAFRSARDYASSALPKCPETSAPRNVLVNVKVLGARSVFGAQAFRHPRERVLNALALLLWEDTATASSPLRTDVQKILQTDATTFCDLVAAYRRVWAQVN